MRFWLNSATAFLWSAQKGASMHTLHRGAVPSDMYTAPSRPQMEHIAFARCAADTRRYDRCVRQHDWRRGPNFPTLFGAMATAD